MKECRCCHQVLSPGHFASAKERKDRLDAYCLVCRKAKNKAYKEKNRERYLAEARARNAEWKGRNRAKVREADRLYRERTPEKGTARVALRRARKRRAVPVWLTTEDKQYMAFLYRLAREATAVTGYAWHVDHIVPLAGKTVCGLHCPENMRLLPAEENFKKCANHNPVDWWDPEVVMAPVFPTPQGETPWVSRMTKRAA